MGQINPILYLAFFFLLVALEGPFYSFAWVPILFCTLAGLITSGVSEEVREGKCPRVPDMRGGKNIPPTLDCTPHDHSVTGSALLPSPFFKMEEEEGGPYRVF